MSIRMNTFRRLVALALPCWFAAGPLTSVVQSIAACRHHAAMHHRMHHDAPCWCDEMTGGSSTVVPPATALPPAPVAALAAPASTVLRVTPATVPLPASPAFAPSPPPPNELA